MQKISKKATLERVPSSDEETPGYGTMALLKFSNGRTGAIHKGTHYGFSWWYGSKYEFIKGTRCNTLSQAITEIKNSLLTNGYKVVDKT